MRSTSALIVGLSLSLLPAVSHASPRASAGATLTETRASATTAKAVEKQSNISERASDDEARYAQREATSPEAQQYRGGDTIVIGASAVTVVLAIVLLVVLL